MKYIKTLLAVLSCACFFIAGRYSVNEHECVNESYKKAYLNYIEKIDSNAIYIKEK